MSDSARWWETKTESLSAVAVDVVVGDANALVYRVKVRSESSETFWSKGHFENVKIVAIRSSEQKFGAKKKNVISH